MLSKLSARKAAKKIRNGDITSRELVTDCLERIKQTDDKIGAWAFLDTELALAQADAMDAHTPEGRAKWSSARRAGRGQRYI